MRPIHPCSAVARPVWNGGHKGEPDQLTAAYRNSLQLAVDNNLATVAFPNISTGIYGFPKDKAAEIAVVTVAEFLGRHGGLTQVTFVCFDKENFSLYEKLL